MNHTTANNGDETEDAESHLQEVVDEVDLDSAAEEDPLTLDPSTSSPNIPLPSPLKASSDTRTSSSRPFPLRPP